MPRSFKHVQHGFLIPTCTRKTTEKGRFYFTPEGNTYPSVTTVLSIVPKDGIEKWKQQVGEEKAARVTTQAGIRGTAFHNLAENYIKNDPNWSKGHMPANIFSFNQILPFVHRIDNIWFQETFLWSDYLRTAGQVDLIAEFDGKLSIIDFKTSRKVKKKEWIQSYFQQEAFYAVAFEERTKKPIKQLVTIMSCDDSEPLLFIEDRDNHIHDFIEIRNQYKELKGI